MELLLTAEFPYVVQEAGIETLKVLSIRISGGVIPVKPITDLLQLNWEMQRTKFKSVDDKGLPHWEVHMRKFPAADGREREQVCLRLETLQRYLDSLRPSRSKCPALVQHFQRELVPTLFEHMRKQGATLSTDGSLAEKHVINIDHELTAEDKLRKCVAGVLHPDDIKWFFDVRKSLVIGQKTPDIVSITGRKVPGKVIWMTTPSLSGPGALAQLQAFLVAGKGRVVTQRDVYQPGQSGDDSFVVPKTVVAEVEPGTTVRLGKPIPSDKVTIKKIAAYKVYAPWAQKQGSN